MNSLDKPKTVLVHKKTIQENRQLNDLYIGFYSNLKQIKLPNGKIIELGSGGGFIKDIIPNMITSDTVKGPGIDKVFSAEKIPYKNNSVACFFMLNVLHHIKKSESAIYEMQRCLKKNGRIVMIEPYISPWSKFIYKNFHRENLDEKGGWTIQGKGRLTDANIALPWIIFIRDRKLFKKRFLKLKIMRVKPHTPFTYILSGGLTKPPLVPYFIFNILNSFEKKIPFLNTKLGLFMTVEIKKT